MGSNPDVNFIKSVCIKFAKIEFDIALHYFQVKAAFIDVYSVKMTLQFLLYNSVPTFSMIVYVNFKNYACKKI